MSLTQTKCIGKAQFEYVLLGVLLEGTAGKPPSSADLHGSTRLLGLSLVGEGAARELGFRV